MAKARLGVLVAILGALLALVAYVLSQVAPEKAPLLLGILVIGIGGGLGFYFFVLLLTVLLHELGHFLAGRAVGFRLMTLVAGPFGWRAEHGRLVRYRVRPARLAGYVVMVPTHETDLIRRFRVLILGGPIASLLWAGLVVGVWRTSELPLVFDMPKGLPIRTMWASFAVTFTLICAVFVLPGTLFPYRVKRLGGMPTDMLWLWILRNDDRPARRLIASALLSNLFLSGMAAKDVPKELIDEATLIQDGSFEELNVLPMKWARELHHDPAGAEAAIARHANLVTAQGANLADPWRTSARTVQAYDAVYRRRDAEAARAWLANVAEPENPTSKAAYRVAQAGIAALDRAENLDDQLAAAEAAVTEASTVSTLNWDWEREWLSEIRKGWPGPSNPANPPEHYDNQGTNHDHQA